VKFGLLGVVGIHPIIHTPTICPDTITPTTDGVLHLYLFSSYFIFKAFRVPDLSLDELPVLQARDSFAVLSAKAFPVRYDVLVFIL
jgi:hypothetical protein